MNPWLVMYLHTCQALDSMTFAQAGELAQDADQDAIGDMGDGYAESALALNMQVERLHWVNSNLVVARGPVWNPLGDLAIGTLAGVVDTAAMAEGHQRIIAALDAFTEAAHRTQRRVIVVSPSWKPAGGERIASDA